MTFASVRFFSQKTQDVCCSNNNELRTQTTRRGILKISIRGSGDLRYIFKFNTPIFEQILRKEEAISIIP